MSTSRDQSSGGSGGMWVELLEVRQFLSTTLPTPSSTGSIPLTGAVLRPVATTTVLLTGTGINAEANQPFRAVIGTIRGLDAIPSGFSLQGSINWGDGTPASKANFVRRPDGTISVLGAHTYAAAGADDITVTVTQVPPPWSEAPIRLIGTFHSKARVITPNGGVTLSETAGVPFTANLGIFRSKLGSANMTASITWGDGSQSLGKILALPTADPLAGGAFAVLGAHTYAATGSYAVHVTVYSSAISPLAGTKPTPTPPTILVAQFDSVIDVLPVLPSATLA
jgi:hypothetical protein